MLPAPLAGWLCVFTAGLHVARIMKECTDSLVIRCTNHMFFSYSLVYLHLSNKQWCFVTMGATQEYVYVLTLNPTMHNNSVNIELVLIL